MIVASQQVFNQEATSCAELKVECPCFRSPVMGGPLQKVIDSVCEVDYSFDSVQLDNSVLKIHSFVY